MAVNIYINGVRVAKASSYSYNKDNEIQEEETFDGIDVSKSDSTSYSVSLTRVDTMTTFENTLENAMQEANGFPLVIQDGNVLVKCSGCHRRSKKVNRDPRGKRKIDMEFRAQDVVEEYR